MKRFISAVAFVVALAIGIVPVAAGERPSMTLRQAVDRAIAHSESLRRMDEREQLTEMQALQNRLNMLESESNMLLAASIANMRYDIARVFSIADRHIQIETLEQSIMTLYMAIVQAEVDLEFYDTDLDIRRRRLAVYRLRNENGLLSDHEFNTAQRAYHQAQLQRHSLEEALDDAYRALEDVLRSVSRGGVRYVIEFDLPFEPLGSRTQDAFAEAAVAGNAGLRRDARELEVRRFEQQRPHGENPQTPLQREQARLNLDWAERDHNTNRTNIRNAAGTLYRSIRSMEANRTVQREQLTTLRSQLDINKHLVELGRMTQLDLDQFRLDLARAEESLRRTEVNHALSLRRLSNPNLVAAGGGLGGGAGTGD